MTKWKEDANLETTTTPETINSYLNNILVSAQRQMRIYASKNTNYVNVIKNNILRWLNVLQKILDQDSYDMITLSEDEYEKLSLNLMPQELEELRFYTDRLQDSYLVRIRKEVALFARDIDNKLLSAPEPRKLTDPEIEFILERLQYVEPRTSDKFTADIAGQKIRANLWLVLETIVITPSPVALDMLISEMSLGFLRSKIEAGFPAGMACSDGIGAPMSQLSLDAIHDAGDNVMGNINVRVCDLLLASLKPKDTITTIMFKDPQSNRSIQLKKGKFVGVTFSHLEWSYDIISREDFQTNEFMSKSWWYEMYMRTFRESFALPSSILRLYLDIDEMFLYRLDPETVINAICSPKEISDGKVYIIRSPLSCPIIEEDGRRVWILDLLFDEESIKKIVLDKSSSMSNLPTKNIMNEFIQKTAVVKLESVVIQGIPGINDLIPSVYDMWQTLRQEIVIQEEEYRLYNVRERSRYNPDLPIWKITIDSIISNNYGITPYQIGEICRISSLNVIGYHENNLIFVQSENNKSPSFLAASSKSFLNTLNRIINSKKFDRVSPEDEERIKQNLPNIQIHSDELNEQELFLIRQHQSYLDSILYKYYAMASIPKAGKRQSLVSILKMYEVDSRRTYSGNIHENMQVLGLLATKKYLFDQLYRIFRSIGSNIGPRHLSLLVDAMFRFGHITGINYSGIKSDPISMASYQRPSESFSNSAMTGTWSKPGMSAAVIMNSGAAMGTGYSKIRSDTKVYRELERYILDNGMLDPETVSKYYESGEYFLPPKSLNLTQGQNVQIDLPDPSKLAAIIGGTCTMSYDSNKTLSTQIRTEEVQSKLLQTFVNDILNGIKQANIDKDVVEASTVTKMKPIDVMGIQPTIRSLLPSVNISVSLEESFDFQLHKLLDLKS